MLTDRIYLKSLAIFKIKKKQFFILIFLGTILNPPPPHPKDIYSMTVIRHKFDKIRKSDPSANLMIYTGCPITTTPSRLFNRALWQMLLG